MENLGSKIVQLLHSVTFVEERSHHDHRTANAAAITKEYYADPT